MNWLQRISQSRQDLENAGYIPLYRGTGQRGFEEIKVTPGGVYGDGVYFYTEPTSARSHATWPGGGVVTAFAKPENVQIFGNVAVVQDPSKLIIRGKIPLEDTSLKGDEWISRTDQALG